MHIQFNPTSHSFFLNVFTCNIIFDLWWPGRSYTVHDPRTNVLLSYGPTVLCLLSYVLWTLMSYGPTVLCPMVILSYVLWSYCLMSYGHIVICPMVLCPITPMVPL